jgi:hypothetical protein
MDLSDLKDKICAAFTGSDEDLQTILAIVDEDVSIFPFNEFEYLICTLIEKNGLTYDQYVDIRSEYIAANPNLWLFEISSPTGFWVKFAQTFIRGKCSKIMNPSKAIDPGHGGKYDLWLDGIKIEVKASRAVDHESEKPLYVKALSRDSARPFLMNFQQLKPQYCDVFIWVSVFRDEIVLWVLGSKEVANHALFSTGQHRGNSGNEGQLHVNQDNIRQFDSYALIGDDLESAIRHAAQRG